MRRSNWLAWGAFALTVLFSVAATILVFVPIPGQPVDPGETANSVLTIVDAVMMALVGAFVSSRLPKNPIGWLFIAAGLALAVGSFVYAYVLLAFWTGAEALPGGAAAAWMSEWVWQIPSLALVLLLYLFPTGTFLSRRWRLVGIASVIVFLTVIAAFAFSFPIYVFTSNGNVPLKLGNPLGLFQLSDPQSPLLSLATGVPLLIAPICLLVRFVRARGVEREQIKWVLYTAALLAISLALSIFIPSTATNLLGGLVSISLPVGVGIAVLRYRLYDIDILIRRTVIYSLVTVTLLVTYFASVVLLQTFFSAVTGSHQNEIVTVLSTLAIAALFVPLRNRIQSVIDKRFNRKKYDAQRVLQTFAQTVRDETDLEKLSSELISVVNETMQPKSVGLWLKQTHEKRV